MRTRRRSISLGLALAAAAVAALAPSAVAATRYAGPGGTGLEPCASDTNPCSIEDAVEGGTVMAGDVVALLPGTYALGAGDAVSISEDITVGGQAGQPRPLITSSDSARRHQRARSGDTGAPGRRRRHRLLCRTLHRGRNRGASLGRSAGTHACTVFSHSGVDGLIRDSVCLNTAGGAAVGGSWETLSTPPGSAT